MSLDIEVRTIPFAAMRYPTIGDYFRQRIIDELYSGAVEAHERLFVRIANLGNEDYEFLVAIHELIEEHLARKHGITEQQITDFDLQFEEWRAQGLVRLCVEPGHDLRCPYRAEHQFAEHIERLVAKELGVDWEAYEKAVMSL